METFTEAQFYLQQIENQKSNTTAYNIRGFDEVRSFAGIWSEENHFACKFTAGIEIYLEDEISYRDYGIKCDHDNFDVLVSKFFLSGNQRVISPGIENVDAEYSEISGYNYLFYLPDITEIEQFFSGTPLQMVRINIDVNFLRSFIQDPNLIPKKLLPLIESDRAPRFHISVGKVTPMMRTIIKQMWEHPYQGAIARMYLEAKVLELLALQLSQLSEFKPDAAKTTLKPTSIDRTYEARDILATRLENPPSISELTRQVGLSNLTLRRGFRELFGTTIVGYINQKRMEQAEQLLRETKFSVTEVANLVGYSHLGHFGAAFKRQFGITPSQCLTRKNRFEI